MKRGDILELKPDVTDITAAAVEVKVINVEGRNVRLESISSGGVRTPIVMTLEQAEAAFTVKRAASEG